MNRINNIVNSLLTNQEADKLIINGLIYIRVINFLRIIYFRNNLSVLENSRLKNFKGCISGQTVLFTSRTTRPDSTRLYLKLLRVAGLVNEAVNKHLE